MQLRVKVDTTKPLQRVISTVGVYSSKAVLNLKYEKLSNFYFHCGMLSHVTR